MALANDSSASLSTALILVELTLGVVFLSLIVPDDAQYRTAGILEWVIAFLGTVYLWLFCGFLDRYFSSPSPFFVHHTHPLHTVHCMYGLTNA